MASLSVLVKSLFTAIALALLADYAFTSEKAVDPSISQPSTDSLEASKFPTNLGSRFGDDVLVYSNEYFSAKYPDMVSTSSGNYYLVARYYLNDGVAVFKSSDGGSTWAELFTVSGGPTPLTFPAIAVPEYTEDYVYVVYTQDNGLQMIRWDLATSSDSTVLIDSNSLGVGRPRIVTDDHDYPGNYSIYVTYETGSSYSYPYSVQFASSSDTGQTWENFNTLEVLTDPYSPEPDIAWGNGRLYVIWEGYDASAGEGTVEVRRSTDKGLSWEPKVLLTTMTGSCWGARIGAVQDADTVLVAYIYRDSPGNDEIQYAFSIDGGVNWSRNNYLTASADSEYELDVTVSPSLGSIHIGYTRGSYDGLYYQKADYSSPTAWSQPQKISPYLSNPSKYPCPTLAVDWTSGEAGIAWHATDDLVNVVYEIFFDRADWIHLPKPEITVNDKNDDFWIASGSTLTVKISMDPGELEGYFHDWWIWAYYETIGVRWYWVWPGNWIQGSVQPALTWPLIPISDYRVGQGVLPVGRWIFNFAVDAPNGVFEGTYLDDVIVTIS